MTGLHSASPRAPNTGLLYLIKYYLLCLFKCDSNVQIFAQKSPGVFGNAFEKQFDYRQFALQLIADLFYP
jgi:hypothetical protein